MHIEDHEVRPRKTLVDTYELSHAPGNRNKDVSLGLSFVIIAAQLAASSMFRRDEDHVTTRHRRVDGHSVGEGHAHHEVQGEEPLQPARPGTRDLQTDKAERE